MSVGHSRLSVYDFMMISWAVTTLHPPHHHPDTDISPHSWGAWSLVCCRQLTEQVPECDDCPHYVRVLHTTCYPPLIHVIA